MTKSSGDLKRYGITMDGEDYEDPQGAWVKFEDIAAAPPEFPRGAIVNGRTLAERLERTGFDCEAGKLALCSDWVEFQRCFEHLAEYVQSQAASANAQGESAATSATMLLDSREAFEADYVRSFGDMPAGFREGFLTSTLERSRSGDGYWSPQSQARWAGWQAGVEWALATPAVPAPAASGPLAFTDEHVSYIAKYGGRCRDCADQDGVCPSSGLPCGGSDKAIRHVLSALAYGLNHKFIMAAVPATDARAEPSEWIADELAEELKRLQALMKAGKSAVPAMAQYTRLNSLRNRVQSRASAAPAEARTRLQAISDIAHYGGLADLSADGAMNAIRGLTLPEFRRGDTNAEAFVRAAITQAASAGTGGKS